MNTKKISINLPWRQFRAHALCQPGVLIWLEGSDEPTLLGDVNCMGGSCDCCLAVSYDDDTVLAALDMRAAIASAASDEAPELVL